MVETKKIALVQPPSRARTPRPPLGLMYISSCLTKEGFENFIIDIKGKEPMQVIQDRILDILNDKSIDIIGITCLVTEIEIVEDMCVQIKKMKPDSIVVLGGAHPTNHPDHFIGAKACIDYFVIGEGEITFTELVKAIRLHTKNKMEIQKTNGIAWFEGNEIKRSPRRELIKNLDSLPFPAYDKIDMNYYTRPTSWGSRPILFSLFWIFSSRGCPFRCKFCIAYEIFGKTVRQRSPKNVADEIEYLVNTYNIDGIFFYDDTFTIGSKRIIALCDEILKRKIRIIFGCQTRVNLIHENAIKKMAEAGCIQIDFGIESGSEKILKLIQKDITVKQVKRAVAICKKYGIRILANMMVNLPEETYEDLDASIKLMKEVNCNVVLWNVTVPYPGCFLQKELMREDYRNLMGFPSDEAFELLETKYKFAKYDIHLKDLIDKLYHIFPHPRYIHLKLKPDYLKRWFLFVDFIFKIKYILAFLRSKRKLSYLKSIVCQTRRK